MSFTTSSKTIINYITPEQFGAIGDGVTNDSTAIQNAVNTGKPVYFSKKTYKINSTITIGSNTLLFGSGSNSILSTTSNISIFTIQGKKNYIENLTFLGNSSGSTQIGINVTGNVGLTLDYTSNHVTNCEFRSLKFAGIYSSKVLGTTGLLHQGSMYVVNCYAESCGNGYYNDDRGEYNHYEGCVAYACTTGLYIAGGNVNFIGGQITDGTTGIQLATGANDGHGQVIGTKINHNTTAISALNIASGFLFSDCMMFVTNVTLTNSNGIKFRNNFFSTFSMTFSNCTFTEFSNNVFRTTPTYTLSSGTAPIFLGNTFDAGVIPSGITNTIYSNTNIISSTFGSSPTLKITAANNNLNAVEIDATFTGSTNSLLNVKNSGSSLYNYKINNASLLGDIDANYSVTLGSSTLATSVGIKASSSPILYYSDMGQGTNLKHWAALTQAGIFKLRTLNDSFTTLLTPLTLDRTGLFTIGNTGVTTQMSYTPSSGLRLQTQSISLSGDAFVPQAIRGVTQLSTGGGNTTLTFVYGSHQETAGTNYVYRFQSGSMSPASGNATINTLSIEPSIAPIGTQSGGTFNVLNLTPTYNFTGRTNTVKGIDYNPTLTSVVGLTHYGLLVRPSASLSGFGTATPTATLQINGSGSNPTLKTVGAGTTTNYNVRNFQSDGTTEIYSLKDSGLFAFTPKIQGSTIGGSWTSTASGQSNVNFGGSFTLGSGSTTISGYKFSPTINGNIAGSNQEFGVLITPNIVGASLNETISSVGIGGGFSGTYNNATHLSIISAGNENFGIRYKQGSGANIWSLNPTGTMLMGSNAAVLIGSANGNGTFTLGASAAQYTVPNNNGNTNAAGHTFTVTNGISSNSGSNAFVRINGVNSANSNPIGFIGLQINPTWNSTSTGSTITGIDYNPTVTAAAGSHYSALFRTGKVVIGDGVATGSTTLSLTRTSAVLNNLLEGFNGNTTNTNSIFLLERTGKVTIRPVWAGSTGNAGLVLTPSWSTGGGGTDNVLTINPTLTQSSGAFGLNMLNLTPTYNTTGTYSGGTATGIDYNPTLTSITGLTHYAARFRSGKVVIGSPSSPADATFVVNRNSIKTQTNIVDFGSANVNSMWKMDASGQIAQNISLSAGGTPLTITSTYAASSGGGPLTSLRINPTLNLTGTATSNVIGIDYNPTVTSILGTHYGLLIRSLNTLSGFGTSTPIATLHVIGSGTTTTAHPVEKIETSSPSITNTKPNKSIYQNKVLTTTSGTTTLHTLAIATGTTTQIKGFVTARRTGGSSGTAQDGAGFEFSGVYNNTGNTATIGSSVTVIGRNQATWNVLLTPSASNLIIQVVGAANNNISWGMTMDVFTMSN